MCYDAATLVEKKIKGFMHSMNKDNPDDLAYLKELEEKLRTLEKDAKPYKNYTLGQAHPELIVFTNDKPYEPQLFKWGLIPYWTKDWPAVLKSWNFTLNARSEEMFDKPSFRIPARKRRCLIPISAFFEYHHQKGKTYPFRIYPKNDEGIMLAGLWDEWTNKETGELLKTFAIVTTTANAFMEKLHNNPQRNEPRMPVILPIEKEKEWLSEFKNENDTERFLNLCKPFPPELLNYYPVGTLRGKNGLGDSPEVAVKVEYPELQPF